MTSPASGHFIEDLSTASSAASSPPTPTSPLPLASPAAAPPRGRNRAFSPIRVPSVKGLGLFGKKKKASAAAGEGEKAPEPVAEASEAAKEEQEAGGSGAVVEEEVAAPAVVVEEVKKEETVVATVEAEVTAEVVEAVKEEEEEVKKEETKEETTELNTAPVPLATLPSSPTLPLISPALQLTPAILTTLPIIPSFEFPTHDEATPTSPKASLSSSASDASSLSSVDFSASVADQIKLMLQHFPAGGNAGEGEEEDAKELVPPPPSDHAHLLTLLARPEVMNGGHSGEVAMEGVLSKKKKQTVWEALERGTHDSFCSIMVSCDLDFLNVTSTSTLNGTPIVTLASYADISDEDEQEVQKVHPHTHTHSQANAAGVNIGGWKVPLPTWPWGSAPKEKGGEVVKKEGEEEEGAKKEKKVVRVWYPSQTQMNLHAAWWGFSIYLPPPIMAKLSDTQVGTLKRVSALATALGYLIKFLPALLDLGPGMLVALALLSSLVPMLGYLASFIAWSWSSIKSYDQGKGVILSATWLCPLLLITRSWDAPSAPASKIIKTPTVGEVAPAVVPAPAAEVVVLAATPAPAAVAVEIDAPVATEIKIAA